jgi:hypothetical protein
MTDRPRTNRSAADVLADWRDAERRIGDESPVTPAKDRAQLEAAALAEEYQRLVADLMEEARDLAANPAAKSSSAASDHAQIRHSDAAGPLVPGRRYSVPPADVGNGRHPERAGARPGALSDDPRSWPNRPKRNR